MLLKDYISQAGKTVVVSAKEMDIPYVTLKRYCDGTRLPKPVFMKKIINWSNGQVLPNDFYDKEER